MPAPQIARTTSTRMFAASSRVRCWVSSSLAICQARESTLRFCACAIVKLFAPATGATVVLLVLLVVTAGGIVEE